MNLFLIFQYGLVGLLVVLVTLFSSVMFCETCTEWVGQRLGLHTKNPILKFLGIGMGGVLLALQALMSYKRAKALEDTAKAQAEAAKAQAKATEEQAKANQNTEQGQRQERLKNAIEHLGHNNASVRLGGTYELFHLAQDTKDLRQTVLDILCAHIRRTTGEDEYRRKYKSEPSEEIQSLLTFLFVQKHEVFKGLDINLQGSWLNGANLNRSRLEGAILTRTHLRSTHLEYARLLGANFSRAVLQGTNLWEASLQEADFWKASLQGAGLEGARLQGANFWKASLQGAQLWKVSLQGAQLEGASLQGVFSQGVFSLIQGLSSGGSFVEAIRACIDQEADLSGVIFAGGLSREEVDSIVKDLPAEKAENLREKLEPHINQPESNELPESSGAIIGAYTTEEAEQWIAEYNEAMSEVPGNNN